MREGMIFGLGVLSGMILLWMVDCYPRPSDKVGEYVARYNEMVRQETPLSVADFGE